MIKNLGENIATLYKKNIITPEERDRLLYLKNSFRNPYSHGSNNKYVEPLQQNYTRVI